MEIIMIAAVSNDGFIADHNGDVASWTTDEDKQFLSRKIQQAPLLIMGRKTYDTVKPQPSEGTLRVVLTSEPEQYTDEHVPDQLQFERISPEQLVSKYRHYGNALLLGGACVYEQFLKADLVTEAYLNTMKNVQLKEGVPLLASGQSFESVANIRTITKNPQSTPATLITRYTLGLPNQRNIA